MPSFMADTPEQVAEERYVSSTPIFKPNHKLMTFPLCECRRLFYVAVTRAEALLVRYL